MYPYTNMMRRLHIATRQRIDEALTQMDLTSAQGHIIGSLMLRKEPPCPRDLEQEFHLSHATVSGLLARMEKKGFIRQEEDPLDRRCKRIYPLPRAVECGEHIHRTIVDSAEQMLRGFTPEEQALFADFLSRSARNMGICENTCENQNKEESPK